MKYEHFTKPMSLQSGGEFLVWHDFVAKLTSSFHGKYKVLNAVGKTG